MDTEQLKRMTILELVVMQRDLTQHPEDAEALKEVRAEISSRK